jgi:membrane-associated protease RseP (regulator of RpoE activity)
MPSAPSDQADEGASWRLNAILFAATIASVFVTGVAMDGSGASVTDPNEGFVHALLGAFAVKAALFHGAQFTGALLLILTAHELGHYITARIHKVDASLPFFIPMPLISPFGTMGAVIRMRGTIPTRRALLDIGASGPLAGLAFAIPLYLWGAAHSHLVAITGSGDMAQLGDSLALRALDHFAVAKIPDGMDLELSPVALAAWAGMFVTMINLLPVGQLDGGHVAYALFGPRQDRFARIVHRSLLAFFFVSLAGYLIRDVHAGFGFVRIGKHVGNSLFWLVWFQILAILGSITRGDSATEEEIPTRTRVFALVGLVALASFGRDHPRPILWAAWFVGLGILLAMEVRGGALSANVSLVSHPKTGEAPLDGTRKVIAIFTLILFALLFMPTPFAM